MKDKHKHESKDPPETKSVNQYKPTNVRLTEPPAGGLPPATPATFTDVMDTSSLHSTSIKNIIVTGVTGQDGSNMVDYL